MIPDDAFLRRLPTVLDAAQVVQLEALVFAADAIEASLASIRQITAHHRERLGEAGGNVRVGLFIFAWTIVDSIHVVRQILTALDYKTPRALAFHEKYEAATVLRNKMDHLAGQAKNLGNAKGRPPLFGVLTYICIPEEKASEKEGKVTVTGGMTAVVTTGRFIREGGSVDYDLDPARGFGGPLKSNGRADGSGRQELAVARGEHLPSRLAMVNTEPRLWLPAARPFLFGVQSLVQ
jgi:hypothetical protein